MKPCFPVIGLSGLAGSGKTTLARLLSENYGYQVISFAGPLKAMARAFGLTPREMAGDLKESPCVALCGRTPRQFMQWLGTEFGREMIGQNIWVEAWRRRVEEAHLDAIADQCDATAKALIVADDVRFPNEAEAIRSMGGIVIRIERYGAGSSSGSGHASESMSIECDMIITNDGGEADLLFKVITALDEKSARDQSWADAANEAA